VGSRSRLREAGLRASVGGPDENVDNLRRGIG
jgi:hypothetical protein